MYEVEKKSRMSVVIFDANRKLTRIMQLKLFQLFALDRCYYSIYIIQLYWGIRNIPALIEYRMWLWLHKSKEGDWL